MTTIPVPPSVVAVLRRGLLEESSRAADLLCQLTAPGRVEDADCYEAAQTQIASARALLKRVGVATPASETSIDLEVDQYAPLVQRIVECRHAGATSEAQDAEHEGRQSSIDRELEQFVTDVKRALDGVRIRRGNPFDAPA